MNKPDYLRENNLTNRMMVASPESELTTPAPIAASQIVVKNPINKVLESFLRYNEIAKNHINTMGSELWCIVTQYSTNSLHFSQDMILKNWPASITKDKDSAPSSLEQIYGDDDRPIHRQKEPA
jgi:hypothetical protein